MTPAYLALAWLVGVGLMAATGEPKAVAGAAALAFATPFLTNRFRHVALWAVLAAVLVVAGAWYYDSTLPPAEPGGIAQYNGGSPDERCREPFRFDVAVYDSPDSCGEPVRFRAVVSGEPDERGSSVRFRLSAREVLDPVDGRWQETSGGVLMRTSLFPRYEYGDLLDISGKLETPFTSEDFDYRDYLARRGVYSTIAYPKTNLLGTGQGDPPRARLYGLRADLGSALADALPQPEASLAQGILLGQRTSLPPSLSEAFNDTGTSHLLAVSGYNVTLVAGLFVATLAWLIGRRPAAWLALGAIVGYAFLVGGQPSVLRAAVMGGLYVVAMALGRQSGGLHALALAAAGMTAFDPQLIEEPSFQLSFASTIGLIVFAPALRARFEALFLPAGADKGDARDALPGVLRGAVELVAVTSAAIAFTLPIVAVHFGRISLIALPANLLTVPAFPLIMVTSALTAVGGMVNSDIGAFFGWLTWPALAYLRAVVEAAADVPSGSLSIDGFEPWQAALYYAGLAGVVWLADRRLFPAPPEWLGRLWDSIAGFRAARAGPTSGSSFDKLRTSEGPSPVLGLAGVLGLASVFVWLLALGHSDEGRLSVTFLDVGQGDAILIESPAGHRVLVDGGPSGEAVSEALGRHLPFWDRHLDLVVLTHLHQDHVTGLVTVLERYDVDQVLAPAVPADAWAADRAWLEALEREHAAVSEPSAGQWIDLGGGARLSVLHPPPSTPAMLADAGEDAGSVVLKVSMGEASFLLAGDLTAKGETYLTNRDADLRATVLKVAHHGSAGSTSRDFLEAVQPLMAVVTVGRDNEYGLPKAETLERLEPRPVFRTDVHGDIEISTDGERLWVEVAREGD
jgi:competence protein ComEC